MSERHMTGPEQMAARAMSETANLSRRDGSEVEALTDEQRKKLSSFVPGASYAREPFGWDERSKGLHAEVLRMLAKAVEDTVERIAQAIEDDVDRQRRTGGGIYTADFSAGTQYAARIARESR